MRRSMLFVLALVAACSEGPTTPDPVPPVEPPSGMALSVIGGDQQSDTVMQQLGQPLAVRVVRDGEGELSIVGQQSVLWSDGDPIPGQIINFVVVEEDGGRIFAGAHLSDSLGEARDIWTLGPKAGTWHVEARAVNPETGEPIVFEVFESVALPGAPASLSLSLSDTILLTSETLFLGDYFQHAEDAYGNTISDANSLTLVAAPTYLRSLGGADVEAEDEGSGTVRVALGSAFAEVNVVSLLDYRDTAWDIEYTCYDGKSYIDEFGSDVHPDSMHTVAVIDSVTRNPGDLRSVTIYTSDTWTVWWENGEVRTGVREGMLQFRQDVGILLWGNGMSTLTSTAYPRAYTLQHGRGPCDQSWTTAAMTFRQ